MSILKKPYELSVWEDVWNGEKFVEKKIAIIGSSEMTSQSRAFGVNLTTNVNGTKKLSFKIYKQYVDAITGDKVNNPFFPYLVSERKIKLEYKNKWYDFIIKNMSESSSTYLCTFQLEDALVQELSKNGFNVELNEKLKNNSGTAEEIAKQVLQETDWDVKSEAFVQTLEEPLVYLRTQYQIPAQSVLDPSLSAGAVEGNSIIIPAGKTVLAFYSSCVEKPYRFQFIYVEDLDTIETDENRIICNKNSQYYIDYSTLEDNYIVKNDQYGFTLPSSFNTTTKNEDGVSNIVISSKYRGRKYVFSQRSNFIPVLNRYVQEYKNPEGVLFYGFQDTKYVSPALVQNIISNNQFKDTSGWTGTRVAGTSVDKTVVSSVYGYFSNGVFVSALDDLSAGRYPVANVEYKSYLKLEIKSSSGLVVNSGPRDNRTIIENMEKGDEWALNAVCRNAQGVIDNKLTYALDEYVYTSPSGNTDGYARKADSNFQASAFSSNKTGADLRGYKIATITRSDYSKDSFKKHSQVRLIISGQVGVYYLENIELFKAEFNDSNSLILPNEEQVNDLTSRVMHSTYNYFLPDAIKDIQNADALVPFFSTKNLSYVTYRPNFVPGAQKIRMVTAKESNYFNILQSIAETFECWLTFEIERDKFGAIQKKVISFKNYIDNPNYTGFRYGVNLKEIKRTYESKKIVTKLIVKDNNNEFAKNGFCTIARAAANPTGENYLYDFQYYFNMGMLNARKFLDTVYVVDGAIGPDINQSHPAGYYNLQGYFPRIKQLNNLIDKKNEILLQFSTDLMHYQAKLETATAGYEAAISGIEQIQSDYYQITFSNIGDAIDGDLAKRSDIKKLLSSYVVYNEQKASHEADKDRYSACVNQSKAKYDQLKQEIESLLEHKQKLNKKFFSTYSRFIQEGTWLDEKYVDDELYYIDAQSVMYNSCYPQVAYTIDVVDVSVLQGLEDFTYELGDKTFVEDLEFFGEKSRAEVIVTEVTEDLDDPSKNKIKVQNFKNQFQDLFQKITATVQQAQYNSGSYEKAVALAEANQARKQQFLTDALMSAEARLSTAGQQSVEWGNDGITVKSVESPCDAIRMIGGAILLSKQDKNGEQQWVTGVTSDGVSASLITAGTLNAGEISIMNYDEPIFRWDSFGISAYDATWQDTDFGTVISGVNSDKFVRFDKHGIYGINGSVNGLSWHPTSYDSIFDKASFALTFEGFQVKSILNETQDVTLTIGRKGNNILDISKRSGDSFDSVFNVSDRGDVTITGNFKIGASSTIDSDAKIGNGDVKLSDLSTKNEMQDFVDALKEEWQDQLDGEITTWFYAGTPTSSNTPAIDWTTPEEQEKHVGDLYYDLNTQYVYRWSCFSNNYFGWQQETSQGVNDALAAAAGAKAAADGKMKVFSKPANAANRWLPSPPYQEGDLWVNASYDPFYSNELLRCNTTVTTGAGRIAHWEKATKYTDDTVANSKMDPSVNGNYSWDFNQQLGLMMWSGQKTYAEDSVYYGNFDRDPSMVFKIGKDSNNIGYLKLRGSGEFTGNITAESGYIGGPTGWVINTGYIGSSITSGSFYIASAGDSSSYWIRAHSASNGGGSRTFSVSKTGQLYAQGADIAGKITATSGYIGPSGNNSFKIEEMTMTSSGTKYLAIHRGLTYNSSGAYYSFANGSFPMVLCPHGVESESNLVANCSASKYWVFLAGKVTSGVVPFGITDTGELYASAGKIAGWTINTDSLMYGSGIGYSSSFCLYPAGKYYSSAIGGSETGLTWALTIDSTFGVTSSGAVYASAGQIGYDTSSGLIKINNSATTGGDDGSQSITSTYFIRGSTNSNGLNLGSIGCGLSNNYFYFGAGGVILRNPSYRLNSGSSTSPHRGLRMSALGLTIEGHNKAADYSNYAFTLHGGGFRVCLLQTSSNTQATGAHNQCTGRSLLFGSSGVYYGEVGGLWSTYMDFDTSDPTTKYGHGWLFQGSRYLRIRTYYGDGTINGYGRIRFDTAYMSSQYSIQVDSDRRLKANISHLEDEQMEIFYDNLIPSKFTLKSQKQAGGYHAGFIAQEVEEALKVAQLPVDYFAGLSRPINDKDTYSISYEEFVSLNTWQIQKLKPRITMAEQEIESLKLEIAQLREEIKNLQNS